MSVGEAGGGGMAGTWLGPPGEHRPQQLAAAGQVPDPGVSQIASFPQSPTR